MNGLKQIVFTLLIISLLFLSCEEKKVRTDAIARVNKAYLFEEDFVKSLPQNYTREDSIFLRQNFINTWAKEQVLLQKAKLNVANENEDIDKLVADYKKKLLIDRYKEALLKQYLDTVITDEDIDRYYEENKRIYRLNEDLVKVKYLYFNKDINDKKEVIKAFRSDEYSDYQLLKEKILEFYSSNLNDSIWVSYSKVKQKLPFLEDEKKIKKINFLQKDDSLGVYLVAVKDILKRNDIAPKSYVIPTIRQMILHKRKLELIKEIEKTVLEDATKEKQFETY